MNWVADEEWIPPSPPEDIEAEQGSRSWQPVDLSHVLNGTYEPPQPTVGERDDGKGLFYPGRLHVIAAESESGKTWLALAAAVTELRRGNSVVYLDFEDDEGGVVGRLITMQQVSHDVIKDRFIYIRPEGALSIPERMQLQALLGRLRPTLAIIDGVTEAMSLQGLDIRDNKAVADFGQMLPRRIAECGPATVLLDHVVKDREARGGNPIGGIHKLNGLNGAMYLLENKSPFGIGLTGRSRVLIRKDRPAQLRRNGVPAHEGLFWYADLVGESRGEDYIEISLTPAEKQDDSKPFRPTHQMAKIAEVLAGAPKGLSKNAIEGAVTGKAAVIRHALEMLVNDEYVVIERIGPASLHKLVKPYPSDDLPRPSSHLVPTSSRTNSSPRPPPLQGDEVGRDEDDPLPRPANFP